MGQWKAPVKTNAAGKVAHGWIAFGHNNKRAHSEL